MQNLKSLVYQIKLVYKLYKCITWGCLNGGFFKELEEAWSINRDIVQYKGPFSLMADYFISNCENVPPFKYFSG